jgi:6-phosphogluconolactonase (cycloisomerase 2 family)
MRLKRTFSILLLLIIITAAHAQPGAGEFMLGVNSLDSTLSVYRLTSQGAVRQQGFYPAAKNPKAVAIHPNGKFAYAVSKTAATIMSYELVYARGRLELSNPREFKVPALSPFSLAIHPSGRFLYVVAREGKIAAYHINSQDGALTPVIASPFTSQYRTRSLIVHRSGRFLYAVNAYANSISAYAIDTGSGALAPLPGSPFQVLDKDVEIHSLWALADVPPGAGGIPYMVASDPQGRFLYVSNWGAAKIAGFRIDQSTGVLQKMAGSPFATGLNPYALATHPSGKFLYAGSWQTDSLWAYRIDAQSGELQPLPQQSFLTGGRAPVSIVFDASGTMAYVANAESANISAFRVDPANGELALEQTTQTRPGPWWLTRPVKVEQPGAGKHLYTLDVQSKQLTLWVANLEDDTHIRRIDSITLPNNDLWAVQEKLEMVYVADVQSKSISTYTLDKSKHRLSRMTDSPQPLPGTPVDLTIDANGWYLYVATKAPDALLAFAIHHDTGSLMPASQPVSLSFTPSELVMDPVARYAYVFSDDRRRVSLFSYRQNTGPLLYERIRFGSPFTVNANASHALIDPSANFLLLTDREDQVVSAYRIDALSGVVNEYNESQPGYPKDELTMSIKPLRELHDHHISAITTHQGVTYIADATSKSLLVYSPDPQSGQLKRIAQFKVPTQVDSLVVTSMD